MKPNRTDIYARIHKGLRKALFEFSELAGNVSSGSTGKMTLLNQRGKRVIEFLELHAEIEERFQLPMLESLNPEFVINDHEDHQRLEIIISDLKHALDQLTSTNVTDDDAYRFYLQLNEFIGQYLIHMNHEEKVTAQFFMDYCQFEDMQGTIEAINAYTTPDQKLLALQYFIPAISLQERIDFLTGIKGKSFQAYQDVMRQIQILLDDDDWIDLIRCMETPGIESDSLQSESTLKPSV